MNNDNNENSNLMLFPGSVIKSNTTINGSMTYTATQDCIVNIINFTSKTYGLGANIIVNDSYKVISTADNMFYGSTLFPLKKNSYFKSDENCSGSYVVFNKN